MTDRVYMIRKGGYWYRPESQGYTSVPADAGLYQIDDAISHAANAQGVGFVAQSEVLKDDLLPRIQSCQIASCTCMTKTPVIDHHSPNCVYRVLEECARTIKRGLIDGK